MIWLQEQLRLGRESGDVLLAMGHHPLLPPSPIYPVFSPGEMLANGETVAQLLADFGVRFLFTGHTHMQNISFYESPRGNLLFEINTASLIGYPSPIRKMTLDGQLMKIETQHIENPASIWVERPISHIAATILNLCCAIFLIRSQTITIGSVKSLQASVYREKQPKNCAYRSMHWGSFSAG